jgi:NDP-sugar pyrophosphorylase family protein
MPQSGNKDSKTLVVMAAGAGSRFGGPKQTTPVGPKGEWLPEYALFDAARAGFDRAVCVIRAELEPEFRSLADRAKSTISVTWIPQRLDDLPRGFQPGARQKPWGTGQALLTVRDVVKTPFAIMNADDFYGAEAYRQGAAAADIAGERGAASVIAMRLDRTLSPYGPVKRGWCQTRDGRVTRVEEVMGIAREGDTLVARGRHAGILFDGSELVSMNFWVFAPSIFGLLGEKFETFLRAHAVDADAEFLLPEVVNELIAEGQLDVLAREAPGPWFGLTYKEDLTEVQTGLKELVSDGVYPSPLFGR